MAIADFEGLCGYLLGLLRRPDPCIMSNHASQRHISIKSRNSRLPQLEMVRNAHLI